MKIGILTLHSNTNYGGGLQQVALVETLRAMGHEPVVLCVVNHSSMSKLKYIGGILTSYPPRQLFKAIGEMMSRVFKKEQKGKILNTELFRRCDDFNLEHLAYTQKFPVCELENYTSDLDAIIVGSDQVWTDVYSPVLPYFGDALGPAFNGRLIAYAACSVHTKAPSYNRKHLRGALGRFHSISVRDKTTFRLVKSLNGSIPEIVADPTMLYDFSAPYLNADIKYDEPYIFCYVLGKLDAEWHSRNISHIREYIGNIKTIVLSVDPNEKFPWADEVRYDVLCNDWMNLLRNTAFVYTNSYHAVLFSLKYRKEFLAYYGDLVRSSRILSLRDDYGLDNRIVAKPWLADLREPIDFDKVDDIQWELISRSMKFLNDALK